jgi:hypothetical protein
MLNKKTTIILATTAIASLISSAVFANKVEIPRAEGEGTFYCEINTLNLLKTVDIDTDNVKIKGFCNGQAYVTKNGHLKSLPINSLRSVYFEYKKTPGKSSSVNVLTSSPDDVTCKLGKGEARKAYSDGDYC